MSKAQKLNTFGSQSLNGGNFYQIIVRDSGERPLLNMFDLGNGTIYDADASQNNVTLPADKIEVDIRVSADTAADFDTAVAQLDALVKTKNTLTGEDASGTTMTCTARCVRMPLRTTPQTHEKLWEEYTLEFKPETKWV